MIDILARIKVVQKRQNFTMNVPPDTCDDDIVLSDAEKEIATLRAELDEWRHGERRYAPLTQDYKEVVAETWALKAENEALKKDAERYRWLRKENARLVDDGSQGYSVCYEEIVGADAYWIGSDLDSVLDAELAKEKS